MGVYIGNNQVIEARGSDYGVVQTTLKSRPWTHWGRCPWITYQADNGVANKAIKVGDRVKIKQTGVPYYPGAVKIPNEAWLRNKVMTVSDLDTRGGVKRALLKEINSWCDVENLVKV